MLSRSGFPNHSWLRRCFFGLSVAMLSLPVCVRCGSCRRGVAGAHPLDFRITNAAARLGKTGDRWRDALTLKQSLERALRKAAK